MILTKFFYCIKAAFVNIRRNLFLSLVTSTTIGITFIICLTFLIFYLNLSAFKKNWVDQLQIIVFLEKNVPAATVDTLVSELGERPDVEQVRFVSSSEALEILRNSLEGQDGILDGLVENPLPASLEIKLRPSALTIDGVDRFVGAIKDSPHFADIEYGQKWLERFMALFDIMKMTGLGLGVFLFLFTYFIIANTIKLMVYSRRDEIEIMKLVGATNFFIKFPFWLEGALQGLAGACAALVFISLSYSFFMNRLVNTLQFYLGTGHFVFLDAPMVLVILLAGAALGLTGSLFSFNKIEGIQA